jgi:hypothetical protein
LRGIRRNGGKSEGERENNFTFGPRQCGLVEKVLQADCLLPSTNDDASENAAARKGKCKIDAEIVFFPISLIYVLCVIEYSDYGCRTMTDACPTRGANRGGSSIDR